MSGCPYFFLPMPSRSSRRQQVMDSFDCRCWGPANDRRPRLGPRLAGRHVVVAAPRNCVASGERNRAHRDGGRCGRWSAGRQIRMGCGSRTRLLGGCAPTERAQRRVGEHGREVVPGLFVVPAPETAERTSAVLRACSDELAERLANDGRVWFVDVGRLDDRAQTTGFVERAAATLLGLLRAAGGRRATPITSRSHSGTGKSHSSVSSSLGHASTDAANCSSSVASTTCGHRARLMISATLSPVC